MSDARTGVFELTLGDSYIGSAYSPQVEVTDTDTGHEVAITYMSPEGIVTERFDVEDGHDGADGYSPTATVTQLTGGATIRITDKDGTTTATVHDGADGYSPTARVTQTATGATISITDKDGTTTATVSNGADGSDGADGFSPTVDVQEIEGGHEVTITDAQGAHSFNVMDGDPAEPGSITDSMLAPDGIKAQVGYLTNDAVGQFNTLEPYLYKRDTYIANGNVDTTLAGYDTYKVPVKHGDLIVMHWSETFWGALSKALYVLTVEFEDGTITRIAIDASNVRWYRFQSGPMQGIARMPENARYFVVTVHRTEFDAITKFMVNTPNMVLNDGTTVRRLQTLTDIDETCAGKSRIFFSTASNGTGIVNNPYSVFLLPVRAGDKIRFSGHESAFSYYATFTSIADETTVNITTSDFTAPDDGILCEFPYVDGSPNATIIAADSIKIDASNVVNAAEPSFDSIEWVSFGDSITAQNKWQPYVVNALGMSHTNCGIGSTPLSGSNANAFWQTVRLDAVKAANPDIVTILGGANDLVLNPVIGTEANLSDKDTSTFIGAYSYIIDNLLTWKPSLRIFILSTTWAHNDGKAYSQTVTYGQFAEACRTVAEYYKLPLVDLYDNSGFNAYTMGSSPNDVYSTDHIHPNDKGARIIASQVIAKMLEVMRVH